VALLPESFWVALLIGTGATGVAYYGYSSHRIGKHFGMVSVPYAAVYAALLVMTFAPAIQTVDRNAAVVMALVSWGLYSRTLMGSRAAKRHLMIQLTLVAVGFVALVVFPLLNLLFPDVQREFATVINALYRLAAVAGWTVGARPGLGPKK
jgi:hypothetical protein